MGDEEIRPQLPLGQQAHQLRAAAGVHAAGLEDQILPIHGGQGERLVFLIHGDQRHGAVGTGQPPGGLEGVPPAGALDHPVGPPALRCGGHGGLQLGIGGVEGQRYQPLLQCQPPPPGVRLHADDVGRAQQGGALRRAQPHRP